MALRLLVLSDLHNDLWHLPVDVDGTRIDAEADVVVLAGDIHEGVQAPIWARNAFPDKQIILVAGNHEFYGRMWNRNLRKIREKSEQLGIYFLERDSVEIYGIRFIGCSLWTDFLLNGEDARKQSMAAAREKMNDYRRIKLDRITGENQEWRETHSDGLLPGMTIQRHRQSVEWLEQQLALTDGSKTVIVTHHAPARKSIPEQFTGHVLSPAYASDLSRLMGKAALWIHGHVHESHDYEINGTRIVCNPRGYPRKVPENPGFNPSLIVEFPMGTFNFSASLSEITQLAGRVIGNRDAGERWLHEPAVALDQKRPIDMLSNDEGVTAVRELLMRIEFGVYM
jgi:Icc-related predicted phosphoesterase